MIGTQQLSKFIPKHFDIFCGLDVDKSSISMTFTDHGEMIKSMKAPYKSHALIQHVRRNYPDQRVAFAYEAGPTGFGLHDDLVAENYVCLVVAPSMIPKAPGDRVKTNRLDSQKLSIALRGGELKGIHVPTAPYRELRHLIHLRDTCVGQVKATKYRIKSMLLLEGIPFPETHSNTSEWSLMVIRKLREMPLNKTHRFKLDQFLEILEFNKKQVLSATREIRQLCRRDPELSRCLAYLISIPGIGTIIATHLLARIGDWRQLGNVRQISAFLGLVPCESSTGDEVHRGNITHIGDSRLRSKLIQGAWTSIRHDPELAAFYQRISSQHHRDHGAKKAIVAVARKLTTRIYAVLKEQRPYQIRRVESKQGSFKDRRDSPLLETTRPWAEAKQKL